MNVSGLPSGTCRDCGQPLGVGPSRRGRHLECDRAHRRELLRRRRQRMGSGPETQPFSGTCENCGESFARTIRTAVLARHGGVVRFCSNRCAQSSWQRRHRYEERKSVAPIRWNNQTSPLDPRLELDTACRCGAALVLGTDPLTGEGVDWCPSCRRSFTVPRRVA